MKTKQEIIASLQVYKNELEKNFGIEQFALFGSYAKEEQNEQSDIDIVVLKMKQKNALTLVKAKNFLSHVLNNDVDIGLYDSFRPFIRKQVEQEMIYV